MHSCCSIDAECALSPVEQACTLTSLHPPSSLDDFMLPNHGISSGNQLFYQTIIDNIDFHACMHPTQSPPPRAAIALHIQLAHPPTISWPSAIDSTQHPLLHYPGQPQYRFSCACTHAHQIWANNPPAPSILLTHTWVLTTTTTLWWHPLPTSYAHSAAAWGYLQPCV